MSQVPRYVDWRERIPIGPKHLSGIPQTDHIWRWGHEALLVSEGHYQLPSGSWSGGGPFYVYKSKADHGVLGFRAERNTVVWDGTIGGVTPGPTAPPAKFAPARTYEQKREDLLPSATTGRARTKPGRPVVGMGQWLIELRDLPRVPISGMLLRRDIINNVPLRSVPAYLLEGLTAFRSLGSEYLNVVFGWRPFVSDVRKMLALYEKLDAQIDQLRRNNGRPVRRRTDLFRDVTTTQTNRGTLGWPFAHCYGAPPGWITGGSVVKSTTRTYKRVWWSGAWQYWIPDPYDVGWTRKAKLALAGALPTPELVWEVLPWSWLVDYFFNAGDVFAGLSSGAVDPILRYSYVMEHTRTTTEHTCESWWTGANQPGVAIWPGGSFTFYSRSEIETKVRTGGGNPFGLGVKLSSLSGSQLGILAALGVSRGLVR